MLLHTGEILNFYDVFVRSPVGGAAQNLLSGRRHIEKDIDNEELNYLVTRLQRKRKLLNNALHITSKAQKKNLLYKINKGVRTYRSSALPRMVDEWVRNGKSIEILNKEFARRKDERRNLAGIENLNKINYKT